MDINTLLAVFTAVFIIFFVEIIIGLGIFVFNSVKKKANPLDIVIYELNEKSYVSRIEKGRRIIDPRRGTKIVTVGFGPKSVKDNLGYHFSDNNMVPCKSGKGRKFLFVAAKDGIFAPLDFAQAETVLKLTDEEKAVLEKLKESNVAVEKLLLEPVSAPERAILEKIRLMHIQAVRLADNPTTLSITPIKFEAIRFALDTHNDTQQIYVDRDKQLARTMIRTAIFILAFVIIAAIVIIILLMNQGPQFAAKLAGDAVTVAPSVLPGLPPG